MALSSAPSISLGWIMASCLWRNNGSVYSSMRAGPELNLEGELKLYAVESSDFFFGLIIDFGTQPFWPAPRGCPFGTSICQTLKKLPIANGVCLFVACNIEQVQDILMIIGSRSQCLGGKVWVKFPHDGLPFPFPRFCAWTWCLGRSKISWK